MMVFRDFGVFSGAGRPINKIYDVIKITGKTFLLFYLFLMSQLFICTKVCLIVSRRVVVGELVNKYLKSVDR